ENLLEETSKTLGVAPESLLGTFDLMVGVNTIRYCHRLRKEDEVAQAIKNLLADQGGCVVIDMNDKFPAFRSRIRDRMEKDATAYYLPSLEEYGRPFKTAEFRILRLENFCWIPHSASAGLTTFMKTMTPLLDSVARSRAMRSLVVAQKAG